MSKAKDTKIDYRGLQAELAQIMAKLEADDFDAETSIANYQRGMVIVDQLQKYLLSAQNSVEKVKADWQAANHKDV